MISCLPHPGHFHQNNSMGVIIILIIIITIIPLLSNQDVIAGHSLACMSSQVSSDSLPVKFQSKEMLQNLRKICTCAEFSQVLKHFFRLKLGANKFFHHNSYVYELWWKNLFALLMADEQKSCCSSH